MAVKERTTDTTRTSMPAAKLPRIHRALVATGPGSLTLKPVPVPALAADEVLVRVAAVALNPSDHKLLDQSTTAGAVAGADFSGTVVRVGDNASVKDTNGRALQAGDRVACFVFGSNPGNPGNGAFGEYVAAPAGLCVQIPTGMDFATAASLPMGILTVGFIFRSLGLELQASDYDDNGHNSGAAANKAGESRGEFVLVHGGATATGTLAIQLLKLAGYTPLATCSPSSAALVRSRGAAAVFDYRSPTVRDEIRAFTGGKLSRAADCIGTAETMALCYGALGDRGGRYAALEQYPRRLTIRRRDVAHDWILGWTILGKEVKLAGAYHRDARPEDRAFGEVWAAKMEGVLAAGRLEPHPVEVSKTGLAAIPAGLDLMRKGQVQGKKLVFLVQ